MANLLCSMHIQDGIKAGHNFPKAMKYHEACKLLTWIPMKSKNLNQISFPFLCLEELQWPFQLIIIDTNYFEVKKEKRIAVIKASSR